MLIVFLSPLYSFEHRFHDDYIGKWICIEQRDECVWLSALEDAISYAQWILSEILKVDPDDDVRNVHETERRPIPPKR